MLLWIFGCAEPIPTNQQSGASQLPPPAARVPSEQPSQEGARDQEPASGCRTTQYWSPSLDPDNTVQLKGRIDGDGTRKQYLIDVISVDQNASVFGVECSTTAELSFALPKEIGTVWLLAFVDANGNGLSKDDVQGRSEEFAVASTDVTDVVVSVQQQMVQEAFSLSPKAGTGAPPEGNPSPEEPPSTQDGRSSP